MTAPAPGQGAADAAFITPALSIYLDAVRALAAFAVLAGHAVQFGLYTGPWPFSEMLQHNAVAVFFVLSGLVIHHSVQRPGATLRDYAVARAARILPVSVAALLFSAGAFAFAASAPLPPLSAAGYDRLSAASLLWPLFFLSEARFGSGPPGNPPYWSLCYEVWFYALFAAAFFLRGGRRIAVTAALAVLAGPKVLTLLPLWLMGVAIGRARALRRLRARGGAACLAASVAGLAWFTLAEAHLIPLRIPFIAAIGDPLGFSRYFLSDALLGVLVALHFVGMRALAPALRRWLEAIERPVRYCANFSFTLYLFHWPMLSVARAAGLGGGDNMMMFGLLLALVLAACAAIAAVTEHRRREVQALIRRLFLGRAPVAARGSLAG